MGAASSKTRNRKSSSEEVVEDTENTSRERVDSAASHTKSLVVSRSKSVVASSTKSFAAHSGSPSKTRVNSDVKESTPTPSPRKDALHRKKKESIYPKLFQFPYTRPKLVQPRIRQQTKCTKDNIANLVATYNCLDSRINRFPWKPRIDDSRNILALREPNSELPILESDVTRQYQRYVTSMEHGPASRWAGIRRQEEMIDMRDTLRNCNKAMHLRFDYLRNEYEDWSPNV